MPRPQTSTRTLRKYGETGAERTGASGCDSVPAVPRTLRIATQHAGRVRRPSVSRLRCPAPDRLLPWRPPERESLSGQSVGFRSRASSYLGVPLGPAESLQCASHERDVAVVIKHGCPHIPHPLGPHVRCLFRTSVLNAAEERRPVGFIAISGRAHSVGRASRPSAALPVAGRDPSEPRPGRSRPAARPINWSAAIEAGPRAGRPGAMPAVVEGVSIGPNEESPLDPPPLDRGHHRPLLVLQLEPPSAAPSTRGEHDSSWYPSLHPLPR
jgi:hypothetical protein